MIRNINNTVKNNCLVQSQELICSRERHVTTTMNDYFVGTLFVSIHYLE